MLGDYTLTSFISTSVLTWSQVYLGPCQTTIMKIFWKNAWKILTTFLIIWLESSHKKNDKPKMTIIQRSFQMSNQATPHKRLAFNLFNYIFEVQKSFTCYISNIGWLFHLCWNLSYQAKSYSNKFFLREPTIVKIKLNN